MEPYFMEIFGNPSANNYHALSPNKAVLKARGQVASLIKCSEEQLLFNSGATEGINHVLKSLFFSSIQEGKNHLVLSSIEHSAVIETAKYLSSLGCELTYLKVNRDGVIDLKQLNDALTAKTFLVCTMLVNNETGVIQPLEEIVTIAQGKNIPVFTDATQAVGKMRMSLNKLEVDYLCFSAHKINGPKGVGVLYTRKPDTLIPYMHGGGQENGRRGGTYNVPGIVGIGAACEIAETDFDERMNYYKKTREAILERFTPNEGFENFKDSLKVPNIISISIINGNGEDFLLGNNKRFSASIGSACSSSLIQYSHVLTAIPDINEKKVIRISI